MQNFIPESYQWVLDYYEESIEPYIIENVFQISRRITLRILTFRRQTLRSTTSIHGRLSPGRWMTRLPLEDSNARKDAAGRQEIIANVEEQFKAYLEGLGITYGEPTEAAGD